MTPRRLRRPERLALDGGLQLHVARSPLTRLLGIALLADLAPDCALLIPRCRSIHTLGMRFAIDVVFLDATGRPVKEVRGLRPCRVASCRAAAGVIERRASADGMMLAMASEQRRRLAAALDPRQPIYRDTYNEYFVLVLSAGGAVAGTQVPLYILMAITGLWSVVPFMLACVAFELVVIFGLARPQMKPHERAGWVALWSGATAAMALFFYYLVAEPTL